MLQKKKRKYEINIYRDAKTKKGGSDLETVGVFPVDT